LVLAIILVSVGLALTTGARGPLLAFIIGVVSLVALARFSIRRRLLTGVLGCLLFSSALVVLPEVSPESGRRVFGLLGQVIPSLDKYGTGAAKLEADGRHERFEEAISAPLSLFGRGVGAYGERVGDPTEYIHNLFLEAYYETGLAGIAVISFVFLYCCTELLRFSIKGRKLAQFCFGSMVFYLVDAQFTGTLIDNVGSLSFLVLGFMAIGVEKRLERLAKANAKSGIDAKGGVRNGFNRRCHNLR
jgi:O-antigen ligase